MNIPEITIETKPDHRSESTVQGKAVDRSPVEGGSHVSRVDAVNKYSDAQPDRQKQHFSKKELDSMIAEVEEHFASNDIKLKFNVLEENDTVQVEIQDSEGKTIRKIPDDTLLKLTKSLKNLSQGFLNEVS